VKIKRRKTYRNCSNWVAAKSTMKEFSVDLLPIT
jgi:hypothetical protein